MKKVLLHDPTFLESEFRSKFGSQLAIRHILFIDKWNNQSAYSYVFGAQSQDPRSKLFFCELGLSVGQGFVPSRITFEEPSNFTAMQAKFSDWANKTKGDKWWSTFLKPDYFVGTLVKDHQSVHCVEPDHDCFSFYHGAYASQLRNHLSTLVECSKADSSFQQKEDLFKVLYRRFDAFATKLQSDATKKRFGTLVE